MFGVLKSRKNRKTFVASSGFSFPRLDAQALERKLKIRDQAARSGRNNQPPTKSDVLDVTEHAIVQYIEEEFNSGHGAAHTHLRKLENIRVSGSEHKNASMLRDVIVQSQDDIQKCIHDKSNSISAKINQADKAQRNLRAFQERHNLHEPAHYPDSEIFYWAIILCIVLVETIANGSFLRAGETLGLIGGINVAIFISVFNVGLSFIIGRGAISATHHRVIFNRIFGWFFFLLYIPLIIFGNLLVGHFRTRVLESATVEEMKTAGFHAIQRTLADPLDLEFKSALLVGIGLTFALVALIDGYKIDDKYPKYGAMDRRARRALRSVEDEKQALRNDMNKKVDLANSELNVRYKTGRDALKSWQLTVEETEGVFDLFQRWAEHLETVGNTLLAQYRDVNKTIRSDQPPDHFNKHVIKLRDKIGPEHAFPAIWQDFPSIEQKNAVYKEWDKTMSDAHQTSSEALNKQRAEALDVLESLFGDEGPGEEIGLGEQSRENIRLIESGEIAPQKSGK